MSLAIERKYALVVPTECVSYASKISQGLVRRKHDTETIVAPATIPYVVLQIVG